MNRMLLISQMAEYEVLVSVNQIVTRDVELVVVASSEEEVCAKVREALEQFPKGVDDLDVKEIRVVKANYWIPRDIDFKSINERGKKVA